MSGRVATTRRAPGPPGRLVFGSLADLQRDPVTLLTRARDRYGDVVRFRYLGPRSWHFFAHPDQVEEILVSRNREFVKGVFARVIDLIIPNGLVTVEGEEWTRQRRLLQPGFGAAKLERLTQAMVDLTDDLLRDWSHAERDGLPLDLRAATRQLACLMTAHLLFGSDLRGRDAIVDRYVWMALAQIDARVLHPLSPMPFLPTPTKLAYWRAAREFGALIREIVAERRRTPQERADLLSALLDARDADTGAPLSDQEVCDQVRTLLITGYETTGVTLAWLFYHLATRPDVAARVRADVHEVLGGGRPDATKVRQLDYVRQVINETLRLYPPTFWLGRQADRACELGGVAIPAGGLICISPYVTHRHPEFWTDPDRFDPDRFGPEAVAGRPRGAYFPFGLGPRHCIGQHLALLEMTIVVAMVTGRWNLVMTEDPHPQPRLQGTLQPSTPIWVHLTRTSPSNATAVRAASG